MAVKSLAVRFLDRGGHDAGRGGFDHVPGVVVVVRSASRISQLQEDRYPELALRSPFATESYPPVEE